MLCWSLPRQLSAFSCHGLEVRFFRRSQLRAWERKQSLPSASSSSLRDNSLPTGPSLCGQRGSTVSSSPHPAAAHRQKLILSSCFFAVVLWGAGHIKICQDRIEFRLLSLYLLYTPIKCVNNERFK